MYKYCSIAFIISLIIFQYCSPTDSGNSTPNIEKIVFSKPSPIYLTDQGVAIIMTVVATDPDGDSLTDFWEATGGIISNYTGGDMSIEWSVHVTGTFTITCTVSDGKSTATKTKEIEILSE